MTQDFEQMCLIRQAGRNQFLERFAHCVRPGDVRLFWAGNLEGRKDLEWRMRKNEKLDVKARWFCGVLYLKNYTKIEDYVSN